MAIETPCIFSLAYFDIQVTRCHIALLPNDNSASCAQLVNGIYFLLNEFLVLVAKISLLIIIDLNVDSTNRIAQVLHLQLVVPNCLVGLLCIVQLSCFFAIMLAVNSNFRLSHASFGLFASQI